MRINTNVSSITAQEAAANTNKEITNSLAKLSSGLKINKASDDASGLAIADKLRTQATSINQGVTNGNSAVTLLQIADKSMAEQSNILDTVKAKLIQANTDTTSDAGRESIRKDISKLLEQLDNIAEQTNYNGNVLLQSSAGDDALSKAASADLSFQIGESKNDIIRNDAIQSNTSGLGGGSETIASGTLIDTQATKEINSTGTMTIAAYEEDGTTDAAENVIISGKVDLLTATAGTMTIENVDAATAEALALLAVTDTDVTDVGGNGTSFTIASGGAVDLNNLDVAAMEITMSGATSGNISITSSGTVQVTNLNATTSTDELHIEGTDITGGDLLSSLSALGEGALTKTKADEFQSVVDNAITDLNGYRGDIGSTQNQVESAVRNLMTQSTNVKAAESIIRDVDYAAESANFNKQNIISQAGSYAISQANSVQQNVLRLLQ